jgi:TonB family protein
LIDFEIMSLKANHACFVTTIMLLCVLVAHGQTQPPDNADAAKTAPTGAFRVGGGVSAPKAIYQPEPEFSEEARKKANFHGTCAVSFVVGPDGRTRDIKVLRSLGLGLDEKAVEAVKNWRFEPGMKDGKPVAVLASAEVTFQSASTPEPNVSTPEPNASAPRPNAYAPEDVASYCTKHPTSFYGAPGTASGVSCSDWARKNQPKH